MVHSAYYLPSRQSFRKQAFEITSPVKSTQNENLTLARLIEDQVFGEICDRRAASATKFACCEAAARAKPDGALA
ncbi:MAG: hypothetical protein DMG53_11930 [Acidobacteria bacterium]|nr:MAG: hypothetical protein DMG53_11930 [Acidobacteriota bacterium]